MVGSSESSPQPATPPAAVAVSKKPTPTEPSPEEVAPAPVVSAVTSAALASVVAVRQRIQPEFPPGGVVAILPGIVIPLLVIMFVGWLAVAASHLMFGMGSLFAWSSPFSQQNPFSQQDPYRSRNPIFGFPNRRR